MSDPRDVGVTRAPATLRERLSDWTDWDLASYQLGRCLGLFEGQSFETDVKHVFWSANPLGEHLLMVLSLLARAGVLELEDVPEDGETRYRWATTAPEPA